MFKSLSHEDARLGLGPKFVLVLIDPFLWSGLGKEPKAFAGGMCPEWPSPGQDHEKELWLKSWQIFQMGCTKNRDKWLHQTEIKFRWLECNIRKAKIFRKENFHAAVTRTLQAAPSQKSPKTKKKGENQSQFAIQASVFPCPFFHVHQSAKPDVQMSCVGKQALV